MYFFLSARLGLVHFLLLTAEYAIGLVFEKDRSVLLNIHDVKETLAGPIVCRGRPPAATRFEKRGAALGSGNMLWTGMRSPNINGLI